jgi:hypothetical protein
VKFSLPKFQLVLLLILAAFSAGVALTYWALTPSFYFEVSMRSNPFTLRHYAGCSSRPARSSFIFYLQLQREFCGSFSRII